MVGCDNTGIEVGESHEKLLFPDLTTTGVKGVMRWLTGQQHACATRKPGHQICFPVMQKKSLFRYHIYHINSNNLEFHFLH